MVDPFAGSCATGEAAERTERRWVCCDLVADYLVGAVGRFQAKAKKARGTDTVKTTESKEDGFYRVCKPGLMWNGLADPPLAADGGAKRVAAREVRVGGAAIVYKPAKPRQLTLWEKRRARVGARTGKGGAGRRKETGRERSRK